MIKRLSWLRSPAKSALAAVALVALVGATAQILPVLEGAASSRADIPAARSEPYAPQKVVYHLGAAESWFGDSFKSKLGNIRNHLTAVGDANAQIAVVMHGDGVNLLLKAKGNSTLASAVDALRARGVRFLVCRNTLLDRRLDVASLHGFTAADIVPSGVAEIASLQQQGYVYLRP